MLSSRVLSRASRSASRLTSLLYPSQNLCSQFFPRHFHSVPRESSFKYISLLHHPNFNSSVQQRFGISSTVPPRPAGKDQENAVENNTSDAEPLKANGDETSDRPEDISVSDAAEKPGSGSECRTMETQQSSKGRRRGPRRVAFSDSDSDEEGEPSMEKLVKLVAEKEELLKLKHKEIEKMQDKVLRSYAEMENVMDRTRREAENSKKYAIQNFAKGLLDVVDNLGRASSVVKDSFTKIDASKDTNGAVPLLKTLLEGVEMTEKQLVEVDLYSCPFYVLIQAFKKFGIEKYDPINEAFDPHRHNAVFQMPDSSKPPGTVAAVIKAGYILHDRVIRPAEVGVTQAAENDSLQSNAAKPGSEA